MEELITTTEILQKLDQLSNAVSQVQGDVDLLKHVHARLLASAASRILTGGEGTPLVTPDVAACLNGKEINNLNMHAGNGTMGGTEAIGTW